RPIAAAELGDAQGVGDTHTTTDEGGYRPEQQLVAGGKPVNGCRHEKRHHRPETPDRKGDVVAGDRAEQIAACDLAVARFPGRYVFRIPVRDAVVATHAVCAFRGRCGGNGRTCLSAWGRRLNHWRSANSTPPGGVHTDPSPRASDITAHPAG